MAAAAAAIAELVPGCPGPIAPGNTLVNGFTPAPLGWEEADVDGVSPFNWDVNFMGSIALNIGLNMGLLSILMNELL